MSSAKRPKALRCQVALLFALTATWLAAPQALAAFPFPAGPPGPPSPYQDLFLPAGEVPPDLSGNETWMYSATPETGAPPDLLGTELGYVRGGHVADDDAAVDTAWQTTTGRPDVQIAVLDSGIKWNDAGAMSNLRFKTWLNRGELPRPNADRPTALEAGVVCGGYVDAYDANGDGVFNIADYACDQRVTDLDADELRRDGPDGVLTAQDVLIAFSDPGFSEPTESRAGGQDDDGNGFVDDVVGWDFLDDDNDPYDDVQYGHGTGEAQDSTAEAANTQGGAGTCPNCMFMPMRVGDSFIADVNRFAAAVLYATDNGALVVQEALGTLNNTRLSRQAVDYAYRHGVTVIASAADEAAQHNNWPSSLPHVILVNSVTQYDSTFTPVPPSYLQFNGCTNFNAKVTVAIPSVSCSSDATGRGSGMAGLIYSAALNASDRGKLDAAPNAACVRAIDGPDPGTAPDPCLVTPNEVRQLMASGTIAGTPQSDDVDFIPGAEPACGAAPTPGCTGNLARVAAVELARPVVSPLIETRSYPAGGGHDQFYGYGRVNMANAVGALVPPPLGNPGVDALIPPEVEITSPQWYDQIDPDQPTFEVRGQVSARPGSGACSYRVLLAPGHYPNNAEVPTGDFEQVATGGCGSRVDGVLATVNIDSLEGRFPATTDFGGPEPTPTPIDNGRPFEAPHGFTVKVVASTTQSGTALTGTDQRAMWLHRDADMLAGFPRKITGNSSQTGDGESSPALVDLDGDNRNELVVGSSDGFVHAFKPDGSELAGWPVRGDQPPFLHTGEPAFQDPGVDPGIGGAMLASVAIGDTNRDGIPEVFAADFEGKLYGWNADGSQFFERESEINFSGKPLAPFEEERNGELNRTQHGFFASPVIADVDGDPQQEIVAAAMDRHLYAWNRDGSDVPGFPVLVVDPSKVAPGGIDPTTHQVSYVAGSGARQQGAIVDTPAVGDLDADPDNTGPDELPEIVIGTNEEYSASDDGGVNADSVNSGAFSLLEQAGVLDPGNTRLYAINPQGDTDADPDPSNAIRAGWPTKIGVAITELLPVVGEGVTGAPVIGPVTCPSGGAGPKVGTIPAAGFAYVLNPNGDSCYGQESGKDRALAANFTGSPQKYDTPVLAAVGLPLFGNLGGPSPSFIAPATGAIRALDLAANEYQGGQDFVMAWQSNTSVPQPGFPGVVNDLQFLTGPSVADIDGLPGEEIVAGTAAFDLAAFSAAGTPVAGWPKLSSDWTVANPVIGSFGTKDTAAGASKVVLGLTRSGYINAYATDAPACSPSSWPRFHHDNANSGDYRRDAVLPGRPEALSASGGSIVFDAPGNDLLCGTAASYRIVTSSNPIDESNFDAATPLAGAPNPAAPGTQQTAAVPGAMRYVAVRAVDEQGNVGRVASLDLQAGPNPDPTPTPTPDPPPTPDPNPPPTPDNPCSHVLPGTSKPDTLIGSDDSDKISGQGGADKIKGGAGDDCLRGGRGRDKISGGEGDDKIHVRGGRRDKVNCGPGDDTVVASSADKVGKSCETVKD